MVDMACIELHQSLTTDRRLHQLAEELRIGRPQALGHLALLWTWALDNAPDGTLDGVRDSVLARSADWPGDPGEFVAALERCKFVCRPLGCSSQGRCVLHLQDWATVAGVALARGGRC
jgi:hypothetical protein